MLKEIKDYYNLADCVKKYSEDIETVGLWNSEKHIFKKYLKPTYKILDVGCGAGRTTINLYKDGFKDILGLDIANNPIEYAKNYCNQNSLDLDFVVGSATELEFENDTFDAVIFSYNGLVCIPGAENRSKAVREICRVLKPNGLFIFTAQDRANEKFKQFWIEEKQRWDTNTQDEKLEKYGDRYLLDENGHMSYIHIASISEIQELCESNGFEIIEKVNNLEIGTPDEIKRETIFWIVRKK